LNIIHIFITTGCYGETTNGGHTHENMFCMTNSCRASHYTTECSTVP